MRIELENGLEDTLWVELTHEPREGDLIATQSGIWQVGETPAGDLVGVRLEDESI